MNSGFLRALLIPVIFLGFLATPVSSYTSSDGAAYSLVHISDTQNLVSFPDTYDFTFSYLESIKERYTISAIIITGDMVNTWNNKKEWEIFSHAVHKTSIPVYVISGNHDTNNGQNYQYYTQYTGNAKDNYVTSFENFDLVGLNSVFRLPVSEEFAVLRKALINSPNNFTLIATHFYMDENGTLSRLGTDIDRQLIVKPTIVLSGHSHGDLIRDTFIGPYPVIEDLTNYQGGIPGASGNVSGGRLFTIITRNNHVEKISSRTLWISPKQSFGPERVHYDEAVPELDAAFTSIEAPECSNKTGICQVPAVMKPDGVWNGIITFFRRLFGLS